MAYLTELTKFMGGPTIVGSPASDFEFIKIIRRGLPKTVINRVVKSSAISADVLFTSLRISKRTLDRRTASTAGRKNNRLKPAESELIYRFSKALVTAAEVLGGRDKAKEWLFAENRALNGERPIDLLDTAIGFEDVLDVLHRIEFGVYS